MPASTTKETVGCLMVAAGVLLFGSGAFLYWLVSALGGYGTPSAQIIEPPRVFRRLF